MRGRIDSNDNDIETQTRKRQLGRGCGRRCRGNRGSKGPSSSLRLTCFCCSPESWNADPPWQGTLRSCCADWDAALCERATFLRKAHLSIRVRVHGCNRRSLVGLMESANGTRHTRLLAESRRLYFWSKAKRFGPTSRASAVTARLIVSTWQRSGQFIDRASWCKQR